MYSRGRRFFSFLFLSLLLALSSAFNTGIYIFWASYVLLFLGSILLQEILLHLLLFFSWLNGRSIFFFRHDLRERMNGNRFQVRQDEIQRKQGFIEIRREEVRRRQTTRIRWIRKMSGTKGFIPRRRGLQLPSICINKASRVSVFSRMHSSVILAKHLRSGFLTWEEEKQDLKERWCKKTWFQFLESSITFSLLCLCYCLFKKIQMTFQVSKRVVWFVESIRFSLTSLTCKTCKIHVIYKRNGVKNKDIKTVPLFFRWWSFLFLLFPLLLFRMCYQGLNERKIQHQHLRCNIVYNKFLLLWLFWRFSGTGLTPCYLSVSQNFGWWCSICHDTYMHKDHPLEQQEYKGFEREQLHLMTLMIQFLNWVSSLL